jgi:beta-galactosidase/beta-glucuronidase
MEPVNDNHITAIVPTADIDRSLLNVVVQTSADNQDVAYVTLRDGEKEVAKGCGVAGQNIVLHVPNTKLWSPDSPFLYSLQVTLKRGEKQMDNVLSYAAMRKISRVKDPQGHWRMQLNNRTLFQYGPLDQGWWPDGLYTAPTDEALRFDIQKTKDLGFNMIRKHVKVEPARWYYHCDRLGMLVWQDMPSGDMGNEWEPRQFMGGTDRDRTEESASNYYREWQEIMDLCMPFPSVVMWVPFNEAWGQFDTREVVAFTREQDPSRLVNPASGGNWPSATGDVVDSHHYPQPYMRLWDPELVNVLGEYGGIGRPIEGHLWQKDRNWGYVQYATEEEAPDEYVRFAEQLLPFV